MKLVTTSGASYDLGQPTIVIGRASTCDIVLSDPRASGKHATLRRDGERYYLSDEGSTNGTFVNSNQLFGSQPLRPGDRITIGQTTLIVQGDSSYDTQPDHPLDKTVLDPSQPRAVQPAPPGYMAPPAVQPAPPGYMVPAAPAYYGVVAPPKDRSLAMILEVLPWFIGFLGIGWIYAGNTGAGVALLLGYWVFLCITYVIAAATVGISLLCTIPLDLVFVIVSAVMLNDYMKNRPGQFR